MSSYGTVTAEVDYSCMHIVMLYAEEGLELDGDAYKLPGFEASDRDKLKQALNAMIDAKNLKEAQKVIRYIFKYDKVHSTNEGAKNIIDAFLKRHASIAHRFDEKNLGVYLQYKDSQVAIAVMLDMLDKDIVVLPVHDSFLVAYESEGLLRQVMFAKFNEIMGKEPRAKSVSKWLGFEVSQYEDPDLMERQAFINKVNHLTLAHPMYSRHYRYKAEFYESLNYGES